MTKRPDATPAPEDFQRVQQRLASLVNDDPAVAINAARGLSAQEVDWRMLRAVVLCDAGERAGDLIAVEEASRIFSELRERFPDEGILNYNLANALTAQARLDRTQRPDWYLQTAALRRRARAHYGHAVASLEGEDRALASQAMTNLGNDFDAAFRWVEAFECYQAALALYPMNGVASGTAATILLRVSSEGILGHQRHLRDVAERLAHHAKSNRETVIEFSGPDAAEAFAKLPSRRGELAKPDLGRNISAYERFVAENRLLLSPVLEGLGHDPRRWDDAHIPSLIEPISAGPQVPPLFAMFNVMKADYLVVRELLFQGLREPPESSPDPGLYFDTLDYAVYGVLPSQLVLAQRAALDLLDKIAVALNERLSVVENPKQVNFHGFWRAVPNNPRWKPALTKVIGEGNPALVALSEIATDLSDGSQEGAPPGLLSAEKRTRHAGTHRFIVLHDLSVGGFRPSAAVEHHDLRSFKKSALLTVRLARAALLHLLEAITYSDRSRGRHSGCLGQMPVHPHHVIRGED